jgi:hypothetical protein
METLEEWVCMHAAHLRTTRMDLGVHESSAKTKTVHMKFSLRLSFELSRNLRGYTVGTNEGF